MKIKKILTICVILLFVGVTIAPTINFNTVKASQQNIIKERTNQRELLFQTISDIAYNKEIQRIILKSQMSRGIVPPTEIPIVTKNQIRQLYFLGLILSKYITKTKIESMVQQNRLLNAMIQKELKTVIEKDATLQNKITQLQDPECECGSNEKTSEWKFPIICTTIYLLMVVLLCTFMFLSIIPNGPIITIFIEYLFLLVAITSAIARNLNCPLPDITPW